MKEYSYAKGFKENMERKQPHLIAVKQKYKKTMMNMKKEEVQRDEYGDPVGNLRSQRNRKQKIFHQTHLMSKHTTTTSKKNLMRSL